MRTYYKTPEIDRWWAKIDQDGPIPEHRPELGPCWVWTGALSHNGYGFFKRADGRMDKAHRFAYEHFIGPIPGGLQVLHHCDLRRCGRPSHLFVGTQKANIQDAVSKGRMAAAERNGMNTRPERRPIGERNARHTHPERTARGERVGIAKLTEASVREIRALYAAGGWTSETLAARFGVGKTAIKYVLNGRTWKHVT